MRPVRPLLLFVLLSALVAHTDAAAPPLAALRSSILLHAGFELGVDADWAVGDRRLYTAPTGNRTQARPGLPDGDLVRHARGEGRFGHALHFTRRMRPTVFFQGERNLGYRTNGWGGAVSVWLRLDPDRDLEPGYCDPLQFVGQGWEMGNMFLEFSKDHAPRHFRYAIQPLKRSWNPGNRGWEDIPDPERPMVPVPRPPFTRAGWTHVVFCFGGINSGRQDGFGRLYLNGREEGAFTGWALPFQWEEHRSALTLGLSYVGWIDDLAVFHRPLTPAEVRAIHEAGQSLGPAAGLAATPAP